LLGAASFLTSVLWGLCAPSAAFAWKGDALNAA